MDNFNKKYSKYSLKYQNLLNMVGGNWACSACTFINKSNSTECEVCGTPNISSQTAALRGPPITISTNEILRNIERLYDRTTDTFVIFTTGIADRGILKFWFENKYINHLLSLIPRNFTNIIVMHFDPNYFEDSSLESINQLSSTEVSTIGNPRYTESFFYNLPFPFEMIDFRKINHLLIDFAHIFSYDPRTGTPVITNHYRQYQTHRADIRLENLNSVYFGYVGGDVKSSSIAFSQFIRINMNGSSTNYIQRMIRKGVPFEPNYPNESISRFLYDLMDKTLINLYRKKYDNITNYDSLIRKSNDVLTSLINYYIDYLFTDHPFNLDVFKEYIIYKVNEYFTNQGYPLI